MVALRHDFFMHPRAKAEQIVAADAFLPWLLLQVSDLLEWKQVDWSNSPQESPAGV